MDKQEFDDIVGKKLGEEQQFQFDESQWEAVESQLQEKKKRRGIIWWYWGAAAAVILLLGIAVNSLFLQKRINQLENQVNNFKKESSVSTPSIDQSTLTNSEVSETVETISDSEKVNRNEEQPQLTVPNFENEIVKQATPNSRRVNPIQTTPNSIMVENNATTIVNPIVQDEKNNFIQTEPNSSDLENEYGQFVENKTENPIIENKSDSEISSIVKAMDWTVFSKLSTKSIELVETTPTIEFAPISTKIKNKFGVKSFATGASGQIGWGIKNVTSSVFANRENDLLAGAVDPAFSENTTSSSSKQLTNLKWWSQLQFSKGISLRTELGWKRITLSTPRSSNVPDNSSIELMDDDSNIYIAQTTFAQSNSGSINQTELVLGAGIMYSPFRKWKIQPYVSLIPEFSWNVSRVEAFTFDAGNTYTQDEKTAFDFKTKQFHLRDLSSRLGVQGVLWKKMAWHTEFGVNLPVNAINPLLLNRYQIGVGVGYLFGR